MTDEERLAQSMHAIFQTPAGQTLRQHLVSEAMTLSALKAGGGGIVANDQRGTDLREGRRWLAVELLGAANIIEGGKGT